MTIDNCDNCGGTHYGSTVCPYEPGEAARLEALRERKNCKAKQNICARLRTDYAGRLSVTHEAADCIEELVGLLQEQHDQILAEMDDGEKMCELGQRIHQTLSHFLHEET